MGPYSLMALALLGALALGLLLVPMAKAGAHRFGVLDHPGERKVHTVPTPRLGGLAVAVSFLLVVLAGFTIAPGLAKDGWLPAQVGDLSFLRDAEKVQGKLLALLAGSVIVFVVGLLDDSLGQRFPVWVKALGQVSAAAVLIAAGVRTSFLPGDALNAALTLLWLVGMTNAFNLLDNMDGLSAGVAFVACSVLLLNALLLGEHFVALILSAFMGSLLGFLVFNFKPASIFLGDCGSLFIGYVMGSLTLLERYVSRAESHLFPVLMPVVVLAVPIADTATVVAIRIFEGRPIYVGDSRHLSHRLVSLGFSQRAAVLFLYLLTFALGLGAVSLTDATLIQAVLILLQTGGVVALILILMFHGRRPLPAGGTP